MELMALEEEHAARLSEATELYDGIEQVEAVVAAQQRYAGVRGVVRA